MRAVHASKKTRQKESSRFRCFFLWTTLTISEVLRSRSLYSQLFSTTQTHTPVCWCRGGGVSICRRSPHLTSISVGVGRPRWRRPHVSSPNFTSTGPVFLLVHNHFACTMPYSWPYSLSGLKFNFIGSLLQKRWCVQIDFTAMTSHATFD